jgi:hypothetical protein
MPADIRAHENLKAKGGEIKMVLLASDFDQSRFLKAEDIKGERKFHIKEVTVETVGDGVDKKQKLICWFTNDAHGLVVNKTNNRVLRGAFGDDTAGWKNKIIVIFTMMVTMRGQLVPGLRVRIPPPKQVQPGPTIMSRGKETQPVGGNSHNQPAAQSAPQPVVQAPVQPVVQATAQPVVTKPSAVLDEEDEDEELSSPVQHDPELDDDQPDDEIPF